MSWNFQTTVTNKTLESNKGLAGYVFDGADGSQMAFWRCESDAMTAEHVTDGDLCMHNMVAEAHVIITGRLPRPCQPEPAV